MLTIIALTIALSTGVIGFYYLIEAKKLKRELTKNAQIFSAQTNELNHYMANCIAHEQVQMHRRQEEQKVARTLAEAKNQTATLQKILDEKQVYFDKKLIDIEAQRDHVLKLFEASEDGRALAVSELQNQNISQLENHAAAQDSITKLKAEIRDLKNQNVAQAHELKQLNARPTIKLGTVDSLRRRSTHNETLFHSMKGLRDMSDERSQNWEVGLKNMATWILTSSHIAIPNDPILSQSIGPLVGEALARIGSSLLECSAEDELTAEKQALRSAEH